MLCPNQANLLYSFNKKEHTSIDKTLKISEDLVNFPSIAVDNTTTYIKSKLKGETVKLIDIQQNETAPTEEGELKQEGALKEAQYGTLPHSYTDLSLVQNESLAQTRAFARHTNSVGSKHTRHQQA